MLGPQPPQPPGRCRGSQPLNHTVRRASPAALSTLLATALALAGCAVTTATTDGGRSGLQRELADTRRQLEEIKHDQERLRAMVEYLQYAVQYGEPVEGAFEPGAEAPLTDQGPAGSSASAIDGLGLELGGGDRGGDEPALPLVSREDSNPLVEDTLAMAMPESPPEPVAAPEAASLTRLPKVFREGLEEGQAPLGLGDEPLEVPMRVSKSLRGSGYDDGLRALADEQWDDAIQYFREFLYKYPNSSWADDAQFWTGEAHLRNASYSSAIKALNQVVLRYSSGDRAAAALMRLADVFTAIGDPIDAKLSLKKLVRVYPDSPEAERAAALLGAGAGG